MWFTVLNNVIENTSVAWLYSNKYPYHCGYKQANKQNKNRIIMVIVLL